jgi:phosphomevalonate kinase
MGEHVSASASAKLVLLGEYAVLEGVPAVVVATEPCAHVFWQPHTHFAVSAPDLNISHASWTCTQEGVCDWGNTPAAHVEALGAVTAVFESMCKHVHTCGGKPRAGLLRIETQGFYDASTRRKWGVGSSAAVVVALVKAWMQAWCGGACVQHAQTVFDVAFEAHKHMQKGQGSGVDVAASVWDGLVQYVFHHISGKGTAHMLPWPSGLAYATVFSGQAVATPPLLQAYHRLKNTQPHVFEPLLKHMHHTCERGIEALRQRDVLGFLDAYQAYSGVFDTLDTLLGRGCVYTPAHRRIAQLVRDEGGVYKPSGAGGGDVGVALWAAESVPTKFFSALLAEGFQTLPFTWRVSKEQ